MQEFFTTQKTQPPAISPFWFVVMMAVLVLVLLISVKYPKSRWLNGTFKGLQVFQLLSLYTWYIAFGLPLANSLPFYHCRLAMFVLVFLPGKSAIKQFFALLGFAGSIFALVYPVFDPYSWPHITGFSFLLGHYALLGNATLYLMNHYDFRSLSYGKIIGFTFLLDAFQVAVNLLTGGNYGLMKVAPVLGTRFVPFNYLLVSTILAATLCLINWVLKKRREPKLSEADSFDS